MSNTLSVRVTNRKSDVGDYFEGTVSIAGLKPTKLARRSDGSTQFPTKSAVSSAARSLAKSLGFADVDVSDSSKTAVAVTGTTSATLKKAAKKSSVSKKPTAKPLAKSKPSTTQS